MNTQQKSLIVGAILGATLGALGGYLFTRGLDVPREEEEGFSLSSLPPGAVVALLIAFMSVLRGIAELGEQV